MTGNMDDKLHYPRTTHRQIDASLWHLNSTTTSLLDLSNFCPPSLYLAILTLIISLPSLPSPWSPTWR